MRLIDRIALNRLIKIITNFILSLIKIFKPKDKEIINVPKPRKRPLRDLLDKLFK